MSESAASGSVAAGLPPPAPSFDSLARLRVPLDLRLTPEQFELVCAETREAVLELAEIWAG